MVLDGPFISKSEGFNSDETLCIQLKLASGQESWILLSKPQILIRSPPFIISFPIEESPNVSCLEIINLDNSVLKSKLCMGRTGS